MVGIIPLRGVCPNKRTCLCNPSGSRRQSLHHFSSRPLLPNHRVRKPGPHEHRKLGGLNFVKWRVLEVGTSCIRHILTIPVIIRQRLCQRIYIALLSDQLPQVPTGERRDRPPDNESACRQTVVFEFLKPLGPLSSRTSAVWRSTSQSSGRGIIFRPRAVGKTTSWTACVAGETWSLSQLQLRASFPPKCLRSRPLSKQAVSS